MGKINPWLDERLKKLHSPATIKLIVEVHDPSRLQEVRGALAAFSGVSVGKTALNMVQVEAPPGAVPVIAAIPGITVHYDAPVGIRSPLGPFGLPLIPDPPKILDPLIGEFRLSAVEIPLTPQQAAARLGPGLIAGAATLPFRLAQQLLGIKTPMGQLQQPGVIIIPTGDVRDLLEVPEDNKTVKTKVAVLDTGLTYPHWLLHPTKGLIQLGTFAGPVPFDGLGHGQWVATAGFGDSAWSRFGLCRGVADPENGTLGAWKVLSDLGFGSNFLIIQGIEAAVKWGAQVISMSLGGELMGSVEDDPLCRVIKSLKDKAIFVVAAGNDGPDPWVIGSPGASPHAVTVGAWSSHYNGLAVFSSRGPNGRWYASHGGTGHQDFTIYGQDMVKPDVVAPGGGPAQDGDPMDLLYSGVVGWMDGAYDLTPLDGFGPMRGTSMATPLAAGVITLAVEHGLVATARDVKQKMARFGGKDPGRGYGMITYKKLR